MCSEAERREKMPNCLREAAAFVVKSQIFPFPSGMAGFNLMTSMAITYPRAILDISVWPDLVGPIFDDHQPSPVLVFVMTNRKHISKGLASSIPFRRLSSTALQRLFKSQKKVAGKLAEWLWVEVVVGLFRKKAPFTTDQVVLWSMTTIRGRVTGQRGWATATSEQAWLATHIECAANQLNYSGDVSRRFMPS